MIRKTAIAALVAALALAGAATADQSVPITGKVQGKFQPTATCFGCGSLIKYIRADRVWCAWQGDHVVIHVRFRNRSVEHVTVHWHPSYTIAGGGTHGAGIGSVEDSGVNAGASRGVVSKQKPKGVPAGSRISVCDPAFEQIQSG